MDRVPRLGEVLVWSFNIFVVFSTLLLLSGCSGEGPARAAATFKAVKRDMDIVVEKGGNIESAANREIRCQVMGQSRVIYLIPEGSHVEKGELLVELDASDLEEHLKQQEIKYQSALASKVQAEETLQIQKSQNESNISQAELALELAIMDLQMYIGSEKALGKGDLVSASVPDISSNTSKSTGASPGADSVPNATISSFSWEEKGFSDQDLERLLSEYLNKPLESFSGGKAAQLYRDAENSAKLAESELERARGEKEGSEALYEKKFIAETQLEADRINFQRSKQNLQKSQEALRLLEQFTHKKSLKTYVSAVIEKKKELERVIRKAHADLAQAQASRNAKAKNCEAEKELLERYQKQVEHCEIRAPGPGMVIYAKPRRHRIMSGQFLEEGAMVHEEQHLVDLPDLDDLRVDVQIHESKIDMVKEGQKGEVTVEAVSGATLTGEVTKVAMLPDHVNRWLNPDLTAYEVFISIEGTDKYELKPGMTANAKIFVARLEDVLCVPVQAVTEIGGKHFVQVVKKGDRVERRPVVTGRYNDVYVHIKEGLEEGEEVLLAKIPHEEIEKEERKVARREPGQMPPPGRKGAGRAMRGEPQKPSAASGRKPSSEDKKKLRPGEGGKRSRPKGKAPGKGKRPERKRPDGKGSSRKAEGRESKGDGGS